MTDRTVAELRRQIEHTRHQLEATVEELAAKADVRGRAETRAADLMDRAGAMTVQLRSTARHPRPIVVMGAAGVVGVVGVAFVVVGVLWKRRGGGC
ncbi:Protein of unknown function [Streptomyces sp. yr375]|uniref:DUF3618 domain-containing protein n=1 Tax=Streptomyces sp. yr375 TaxID=1761906 RepID=UPI0008D42672|nr:DUF3618 domain-containing protein [Streptomyces sp. yr375]SEQ57065.1 Protein of unknown function [Streptomyces sp. yr375]